MNLSQISIMEKINQLRKVDQLVDISKSTLQLDILLSLDRDKEITVSDLVSILGQRRKAITDALRKLRNKGLIEFSPDGKYYKLTENGIQCIKMLVDFVGCPSSGTELVDKVRIQMPDRCNIEALPSASIASQIIMTMGTSKGYRMTLKEIARSIGLSPQRTQSYLDLYLEKEPRLFKKYADETSLSSLLSKFGIKLRRYETYYALTQEGLQHFYKLPIYLKLKQSLAYRILSKLTLTTNPRSIFRRLNFLLYGCGLISAISIALQISPIVPWAWAVFSLIVGVVAIADLFLYRSI
ncbi:MAG: MarR family transcriptional regulator [Candidatus Methanomethylicaceae archaeon]